MENINEIFNTERLNKFIKEKIGFIMDEDFSVLNSNILTKDNFSSEMGEFVEETASDAFNTSIADWADSSLLDYIDVSSFDIDYSVEAHKLLDQFSPTNSCGASKKAYEAIIDSIRYDLMCHGIKESTRESHYVHEDSLTIFNQLKRVIEEIVDDRLRKVELVKTFDKTTKVEIIDDLVPSTAFPCTHFKITTYTQEQSEAIKAFLFSNNQMQESRVQFTTKTNTLENPL